MFLILKLYFVLFLLKSFLLSIPINNNINDNYNNINNNDNSLNNINNNKKNDKKEVLKLLKKFENITPMKIRELELEDHIEGGRVERDGDLNTNFKQELIIGNYRHLEFATTEKYDNKYLINLFRKIDTNDDNNIDNNEIYNRMMSMVDQHFNNSIEENKDIFSHLDTDKNGYVSWDEYCIHFLLAKGFSIKNATSIITDEKNYFNIDNNIKESLLRYRFRWFDVDNIPPLEGNLNEQELLYFRHPELNDKLLWQQAKQQFDKFDTNEDDILTEEEFAEILSKTNSIFNYDNDNHFIMTQNERRLEFKNFIDTNRDGQVTLEELKIYLEPKNKNLIRIESENLLLLLDNNKNNLLSFEEFINNNNNNNINNNNNLFLLKSKLFDSEESFHDEF